MIFLLKLFFFKFWYSFEQLLLHWEGQNCMFWHSWESGSQQSTQGWEICLLSFSTFVVVRTSRPLCVYIRAYDLFEDKKIPPDWELIYAHDVIYQELTGIWKDLHPNFQQNSDTHRFKWLHIYYEEGEFYSH